MNCWKGVCKYKEGQICTVDNKPCDFTKNFSECHCHQENNKKLRKINRDTIYLRNIPEEHHYLSFWSCENICRFYDICDET